MKSLVVLVAGAILAQAAEPAAGVIIRRDIFGVPHILADSDEAAALAHGYVTAEDHAPEMARVLLRARGRQAEFLGDRFVEDDFRVHQLRIFEVAAERFTALSAPMQRILDAYADGYNRYIAAHSSELPAYARPVTGIDVLAHCRTVFLLSFALDLRGFDVPRRGASEQGSNMWAIGRKKSGNGSGLLLINPHLSWSSPYLLHEVHIRVPGRRNVMGAAVVGSPVIGMGFNEHFGWAHTVIDEKYDQLVTLPLGTLDVRTKAISIKVLTPKGLETRARNIEYSQYGPLLRREGDQAVVFRSVNLNLVEFLDQWDRMARAESFSSFRDAVGMQAIAGFNVGYADDRGNAYYLYGARIPQRVQDPREWGALLPLAALPQLLNPSRGYIQNSNGPPWFPSAEDRIDPLKHLDIPANKPLDFRTQLSMQLLESRKKLTLSDIMQLSRDNRLLLAERVKSGLLASIARSGAAAGLANEVYLLQSWDGRVAASSRGAALFALWWTEYSRNAKPAFETPWNPQRPTETPSGIGDPAEAVAALQRASARAVKEYGKLDATWGDVHRFRQENVDLPVSGAPGALGAFRVLGFRRDPDSRNRAVFGDSYLAAIEFRGRPRAFTVLAYSQSSRPGSKHYSDQAKLFTNGEMKPAFFDERELRRNIERSYSPPPATAVAARAR